MLQRINFFFAVAALAVTVFYVVGRYLIVLPVSLVLPGLAPYVAGVVILAGLMLIVRSLSDTMSNFETLTFAARTRPTGMIGHVAQGLIVAAHGLVAVGAWQLMAREDPAAAIPALAIAVWLYAGGVFAALADWRRRAAKAG
jgi:hypothetical protein